MEKKTGIWILSFILLVGSSAALTANIQPSDPADITLNSTNNYDFPREFDGTSSTGSITSYSWTVVGDSQSGSGPTETFTFDRSSSGSNTVRLTVSNGTTSDTAEVTQTLHDVPEIKSATDSGDVDLNDSDGKVDFNVVVEDEFDRPLGYEWTDAGGSVVANQANFTYDFNNTGDYTFTVNVSDGAGLFSTGSTTVDVSESTSSNNNNNNNQNQGGGGGGTGPTFEEGYIFGNVEDGEIVEADFDDSPVTSVSIGFSSGEEDTELESHAEESMDDLPNGGVDDEPEGVSYRYIELNPVNFSDSDVNNVSFEFEVEKEWIQDNEIVESSVKLQRYDDGWDKLDTEKTGEDSDELFFNANSSGFSVFSITGKKKSPEFEVKGIDVTPDNPSPGENFTVTVNVENTGTNNGTYTIEFEISGNQFERDLEINGGETESAEFQASVDSNGSYSVEVGGESTSFQVGETVGSLTEGEEAEEEDDVQETEIKEDGGSGVLIPVVAILLLLLFVGAGLYVYTDEEQREEVLDTVTEFLTGEEEEKEEEIEWEGFD